MWALENEIFVFFDKIKINVDLHFTLKIQTPWQLRCMLKWGHKRTISMDATFGTNNVNFDLLYCLCLMTRK